MTTPGRMVYRPVMGRVLAGCYVVFAVWWLVAGFTGGESSGVSWTVFAWLLAVGAAAYGMLWRPAVVVDPEGVRLLNILRDVRVPWAALEAVETRYALTLVTAGCSYVSWAAGAPGRGSPVIRMGHGRGPGAMASEAVLEAEAAHLPRAGWIPGGVSPDRSSRDLRTDSGAAAFMVEQAWVGWRERPQAKAQTELDARLDARLDADADAPVPLVAVSWNVPVLAALAGLVAVALLLGVLHT